MDKPKGPLASKVELKEELDRYRKALDYLWHKTKLNNHQADVVREALWWK